MNLQSILVNSPILPWRVRNGFEQWLETRCRNGWPAAYRWMHFGQAADPLEPVTHGPLHHFFGYYDKSPWNATGRLMLAHEAAFNDRPPREDDPVTIGLVRLDEGRRFEPLA